jgi:hypothetical protein
MEEAQHPLPLALPLDMLRVWCAWRNVWSRFSSEQAGVAGQGSLGFCSVFSMSTDVETQNQLMVHDIHDSNAKNVMNGESRVRAKSSTKRSVLKYDYTVAPS